VALFSRQRRTLDRAGTGTGTDRFWSWWQQSRDDVTDALDAGPVEWVRGLLEPRVQAIHPDLTWFAGPGVTARHMLVLSGARHPGLRVLTERWRRAGPPGDPSWEYHPAYPAQPGAFCGRVQVGGLTLEAAQATAQVQVDDQRYRMDLVVHHPAFEPLPELDRRRLAHVLVGWSLGEDDTDRWVGQLDATTLRPLDAVPVAMLGAVARQLGDRWGHERWAYLEGSFGDRRLIAAARHPLHRVDHPLFDEHLAVRLPYTDALPDGLPGARALQELDAAERRLVGGLGRDALLVAHQTSSGERLLHFYGDSEHSPLQAVRSLVVGYPGGEVGVQAVLDPSWENVDHLRP
jgi:hypothetical protein